MTNTKNTPTHLVAEAGAKADRRSHGANHHNSYSQQAAEIVGMIDIPQKMGGSRKNAADIKMAIDVIELALDRDYISTFVI